MRIGIGYDAHRLVIDRPLILGGCHIPYEKGLLGHSDADVLVHSIADALLGAAALGDIGRHFPDSSKEYKDISSLAILKKTGNMLKSYAISNIDAVIIAQNPRLADYLPLMEENIARELAIPKDLVNVKATTEEGMGFTGSGEGIAAKAVALLILKGV
jgi:2-C-methyl-D-erythritol 2,4-cyclodiphosphate synthase